MRARNIKPGFFINPELAECSFAARLLFAGLWMLADRNGRLLDRPRHIKGELFRYDDSVDVDALLGELAGRDFIDRYEVDGIKLIQVVAFSTHQNPHPKEKDGGFPQNPSKPPKPCNYTTSREKVGTGPAESVIMNHESVILKPTAPPAPVNTHPEKQPWWKARKAIETDDGPKWPHELKNRK